MGYLYVPGMVASSSDSGSHSEPAIALCVSLNGKPARRPLSWRGWQTRHWIRLLSGTTFAPSTAARGAESWISSLRDSRASRGLSPAAEPAPPMIAGSGPISGEWFVRWDHDSSSWKTCQGSYLADLGTFSETWPKAGSLRNGAVSRRRNVALRTGASGSSSWPTPRAIYGEHPGMTDTHHLTGVALWGTPTSHERTQAPRQVDHGVSLANQVLWQTPAVDSFRGRGGDRQDEMGLPRQAKAALYPTPTSQDAIKNRINPSQSRRHSPPLSQIGRTLPDTGGDGRLDLSPPFVEWLMGVPIGWTDCECSATESYQSWLQRHSKRLRSAEV